MSRTRVATLLATAAAISLLLIHNGGAQNTEPETLQPGARVYPVHFPTGGSKLDTSDQETIRGIASSIKSNPSLSATIIGRADTVGSPELNEKLSEQRSQAVFEALVNTNQVPESRVEMKWTGEHMPYLSTADEQEEMLNRVVEVIVR
jgi:OOP family OmpA-OmpF porin